MTTDTHQIENPDEHAPESIIGDDAKRAVKEAENGLDQFTFAREVISNAVSDDRVFKLRPSLLLELNRLAIDGVMRSAGRYRSIQVKVGNHMPPKWNDVPGHVDDMVDYVNENINADPIHIAAYLLWRLNWIHPFVDGNGRTTRMISYIVLCARLGVELPGINTIPEQIAATKSSHGGNAPYYKGLQAADAAWANGVIDVSGLEQMINDMLKVQLESHFNG